MEQKDNTRYTITLTKRQLELLSEITNKFARVIIGQLDYGIGEELTEAYKVNVGKEAHTTPVNNYLNIIKKVVFNQESNQSFGVGYSDKADTLFDMHEVIRHQLWKDNEDKLDYVNQAYPAFHWNKEIPLIKVNKV